MRQSSFEELLKAMFGSDFDEMYMERPEYTKKKIEQQIKEHEAAAEKFKSAATSYLQFVNREEKIIQQLKEQLEEITTN